MNPSYCFQQISLFISTSTAAIFFFLFFLVKSYQSVPQKNLSFPFFILQTFYYGISSIDQNSVLKFHPQCISMWRWGLLVAIRFRWRLEGGFLTMRLVPLYRETPESLCLSLHLVRTQWEGGDLQASKRAFTRDPNQSTPSS